VRELVLERRAELPKDDWILSLADLQQDLANAALAPGPERGLDRFWIALLLAFHGSESALRIEEARAILRSTAGEQEAVFGQYWCLRISGEHYGAGQLEDADRFAEFGLTHFAAQPLYSQELWKTRARIALENGRIREAKAHLDALTRSIPALEGIGPQDRARMAATAEGEWAVLWMNLGVMDRAADLLARAESLARSAGGPLPELFLLRADFLLLSEDFERLEQEIERWKSEVDPLDARLASLFELYLGVARSELEREDPAGREKTAESTLRALLERSAAAPEALSDKERVKIWIELVDLELRDGDVPGAAEGVRQARRALAGSGPTASSELAPLLCVYEARMALARGASREELLSVRSSCQAHYDDLLESWSNSLHPPGGIGFLHWASRRQVLCTLIELVLRTEPPGTREERALDLVLRAQSMGTLGADWNLRTEVTTERVRKVFVGERHGVLVYLPAKLEESSHLFVVDRDGTQHVSLPSRDGMRAAIDPLEKGLAVRPANLGVDARAFHAARLSRASRAAAEVLLPESIRPRISGWRDVTVVGGELLGTLPFECLMLEDGRLLGQTHAVSSLPSLAVGLALAERPLPDFSFDLGLVASLEIAPDLLAHPDVARSPIAGIPIPNADLGKLTSGVEPDSLWTLIGPQADQRSLFAAGQLVQRTRIVDFLLHGVYLRDLERGSALLLAGGGGGDASFLTADEVEARLRLEGIVLLSSCGTGLGPERLGDDNLANLGGAFLRAGARCVVLSRAPLEYGATVEIMRRVHAELLAGKSPAEALRIARSERGLRVDAVDAFADAGIRAVGLGHRPIRPPATTTGAEGR